MHISTPANNRELLLRAARGDEDSFSELFDTHHGRLVAFVARMTGSTETAKDIVQEVFIKVWEKKEALADVRQFDAYLYILARNRTINCLRQLASERVKKEESKERLRVLSEIDSEDLSDYYALLDEAVENLPPQQQTAYILSRRKRHTYQEIALQMDLSGETVKKYLKLASRSVTSYLRANAGK